MLKMFTGLFMLQHLVNGALKGYLTFTYGAERYDFILAAMRTSNWFFGALFIIGYIVLSKQIKSVTQQMNQTKNHSAQ
ncbi:MAG: hypothetical protein LRY73_09410 [Bacillus sp. (in: Bacteria)]|nr:hypothetical protein [Bacillus sp. (in: firmicutes)]